MRDLSGCNGNGGYVPKQIFLSYAADDREKAQRLVTALESAGIDVWWDQRIAGGARYETEIEKALNASDLVIVGWSDAGNQSDWVKDEAEYARGLGKLFPVSFDGSMPPIGFRQYQVAPFPERSGDNAFDELIDAVQARLAGRSVQSVQSSASSKRRPKSWLAIAAVFMAALAAWALYAFSTDKTPAASLEPLVMIMDSAHPARIYDDEVRESGGTNADILSDILSDLPIQTQKELISPGWQRNEAILQFGPDLIVIHYSGFKQEDARGDRPQLRLLIQYFAETDTQFLVYSRAGNEWLQTNLDKVLTDVYAAHPMLRDRVFIYPLLEYGEANWSDPASSQGIKLKVKEVLTLGND